MSELTRNVSRESLECRPRRWTHIASSRVLISTPEFGPFSWPTSRTAMTSIALD